jgi:hypothetical protein
MVFRPAGLKRGNFKRTCFKKTSNLNLIPKLFRTLLERSIFSPALALSFGTGFG